MPQSRSFPRNWRKVVARSQFLEERLEDGSRRSRSALDGLDAETDAERVLEQWTKAFSPGDPAALERRLRWDGLDAETVRRALAAPSSAEGVWTRWLDSLLEESARLSRSTLDKETVDGLLASAGIAVEEEEHPPFLELWLPALEAAREELDPSSLPSRVTPSASAASSKQLLCELAATAAMAVFRQYRLAAAEGASEGDAGEFYAAFITDMWSGGLEELFRELPVLARQLATVMARWVESTRELMARLDHDAPALAELFDLTELGKLAELEPGLSDPHDGRRRVARLHFDSGVVVVYKARQVRIEREYNELLRWLAEAGLEPAPPRLRVLCREGYGWVEAAEHRDVSEREAIEGYFERAGVLFFVTHLLKGRDLHMENLIATPEGPRVTDPEMLFQPVSAAAASEPSDEPDAVSSASCLETGLLSVIDVGPRGELYDIGGLRGTGTAPSAVPARVWKHHRTPRLTYEETSRTERPPANRVTLNGVPQRPREFALELVSGFVEAYRFCLERREALRRRLESFAATRVRVLVRPSVHYAMALRVLTDRQYQRDGISSSLVLEALHRGFANSEERPLLWPVARHEKERLLHLDIPRFTLGTGETSLRVPNEGVVESFYATPGMDAVVRRLENLSEEDLRFQVETLVDALESAMGDRFEVSAPSSATSEHDGVTPEGWTRLALWIGEELLRWREKRLRRQLRRFDLVEAGLQPRRFHLYDGSLGEALFYAALASTTGDARWAGVAREAVRELSEAMQKPEVRTALAHDDLGACSGLSSTIYALSAVGSFLRDQDIIETSYRVSELITEERISADRSLDVVGGVAGTILVLSCLLRRRDDDDRIRRLIEHCGVRLLNAAVTTETGKSWPVHGRLIAGFGHGAAGIATAFLRAYEATEDERFLDAAGEAYASERRLFSPALGNWEIVTPRATMRRVVITAWCNGAPGVALARALHRELVRDEAVESEMERALRVTEEASDQGSDHLCCGNLGRAEVLLTAGRRLDRRTVVDSAYDLAGRVADRALKHGHFRLKSSGFSYPIHSSSFFRGLPGIGYEMLRLADSTQIPSVLAFEPHLDHLDLDAHEEEP